VKRKLVSLPRTRPSMHGFDAYKPCKGKADERTWELDLYNASKRHLDCVGL
jgi:hypothetical protein